MSSGQSMYTDPDTGAQSGSSAGYDAGRSGWATFAAIMLTILGLLNIVYGIAAIDNANFFVNNAQYVFSDLNTWGWIILIIGITQLSAAVSIFGGTGWGRWVGVATAGVNAIAQLMFLPSSPFLSISLFAVDVLIIYGLVSYDPRRRIA